MLTAYRTVGKEWHLLIVFTLQVAIILNAGLNQYPTGITLPSRGCTKLVQASNHLVLTPGWSRGMNHRASKLNTVELQDSTEKAAANYRYTHNGTRCWNIS